MKKVKNLLRLTVLGAIIVLSASSLIACHAYDAPEMVTITPSQTAFLIPLDGKTSVQSTFMSEAFLAKAKVASKRVTIPHEWVKTGYGGSSGHYMPTEQLIVVERKPVTREWTSETKTGTSTQNQGITAESKESISFVAQMNICAQIDETDAVKFLYRYNNKSLADIMDSEIRARISSDFVEQCSQYTLDEILIKKASIMNSVRTDVTPYFAKRGITITVLGLQGELTYLNTDIQKSIDSKFESEQALITQENTNKVTIAKAKADAEAIKAQQQTIAEQIKLQEVQNSAAAISKWNGKMPTYVGGSGTIFGINTSGDSTK